MEQQESNQLSCAQKCTQGTPEGASFPGCDTTQPQPPGMRHLPPDFAANCPAKAPKHHQARVVDGVEFLLDDANLAHLRGGGALYSCSCKEGSVMTDLQLRMAASFVNISSFDDELKENCVPYVDPLSDDAKSYVYLLNKAMYLMPKKVRSEDLNSKVFSSVDFHKNCQPGKPKVWTDVQEHHTFRLTKTVIPILFSVTFQLKCSAVPKEHYASLAVLCDNLPVHHVCQEMHRYHASLHHCITAYTSLHHTGNADGENEAHGSGTGLNTEAEEHPLLPLPAAGGNGMCEPRSFPPCPSPPPPRPPYRSTKNKTGRHERDCGSEQFRAPCDRTCGGQALLHGCG